MEKSDPKKEDIIEPEDVDVPQPKIGLDDDDKIELEKTVSPNISVGERRLEKKLFEIDSLREIDDSYISENTDFETSEELVNEIQDGLDLDKKPGEIADVVEKRIDKLLGERASNFYLEWILDEYDKMLDIVENEDK